MQPDAPLLGNSEQTAYAQMVIEDAAKKWGAGDRWALALSTIRRLRRENATLAGRVGSRT